MNQTEIYGTDEIALIKKKCADSIYEFGRMFQIMRELYEGFGMYYPKECNTNYRDSWFHYRKLYVKKDKISVLNEKYGLEEHLLRAVKDAQIYFLQQLGEWLMLWCSYKKYFYYDRTDLPKYIAILNHTALEEKNWVASVWKQCGGDRKLFASTCLYQFENSIESDMLQVKLNELVCGIKNLILDLRLGGVDIYRPTDNTYYLEKCISMYNNLCLSLREKGMLYLISATELIWNECGKKNLETN